MNTDSTFIYKSLFGPVPSRRLGISLGIDLVPHKTCNLNCVYCECGPTTHLTMQRKEYIAVERVKEELADYLSRNEKIDHITFAGSGEPTLNEGIGDIIDFLKKEYPRYPVALLSNGTLFDRPEVRRQVASVDVIMASLDAATPMQFRRVNRPHPQLDLDAMVAGLKALREDYLGRLLMEYFVIDGVNDAADELSSMKIILEQIGADGVILNTLDRPGAEAWVAPVSADRLKAISVFLEDADMIRHDPGLRTDAYQHPDLIERLVATVRRRPYTAMDVSTIIGIDVDRLQPMLDRLVAANQLTMKQMDRGRFYLAS